MNWRLLLEALAGRAPGFTSKDTRTLRLIALGLGLVFVFLGWCAIDWVFAPAAPVAVTGTLVYQGIPVEKGEIEFYPAPGEKASRHSIRVENGKFFLPAGQGLLRNKKYIVKAKAFRKTGRVYENASAEESADEYEQYIPGKYNSDSNVVFVADRASLSKGLDLDLR